MNQNNNQHIVNEIIQKVMEAIINERGLNVKTCHSIINEYIDQKKIAFTDKNDRERFIKKIKDDAIVRACTELEECEPIIKQYANLIYKVIQNILIKNNKPAAKNDVEDYQHDIYFQLLNKNKEKLRKFNSNIASLTTWIVIITRRTMINKLKRKDPINPTTVPLDEIFEASPISEQKVVEILLIIGKISNYLTHSEKIVLKGMILGKSSKEIAEELNITPGAVDNIRSKVKKKFKIILFIISICDEIESFKRLNQDVKHKIIEQTIYHIESTNDPTIKKILDSLDMNLSAHDIINQTNDRLKDIKKKLSNLIKVIIDNT